MHNLKVDKYILFLDLTEDYNLGDSLSECFEELFPRSEEELGYIGIFAEKQKANQKPL